MTNALLIVSICVCSMVAFSTVAQKSVTVLPVEPAGPQPSRPALPLLLAQQGSRCCVGRTCQCMVVGWAPSRLCFRCLLHFRSSSATVDSA